MERAGFILVGGGSTRMGTDKALLPYDGGTLAGHVASVVGEAVGPPQLVGPPDRYGHLGFPVIPDAVAGLGPLGGILTALRASSADWNLVVACDMPALRPDFLRSLADAAEEAGGDCLIPVSPSGPEPLCAVYHRRCLPSIELAAREGRRKITDALAGLRIVHWPVSEAGWFENVNTPQQWAAHAGASAARSPQPDGRA